MPNDHATLSQPQSKGEGGGRKVVSKERWKTGRKEAYKQGNKETKKGNRARKQRK